MRNARWLGAVGAVVFAVGLFMLGTVPGGGDVDPGDFEEFYVEDENTVIPIIGFYLMTLGVLGMLWFFHELRELAASSLARLGFAAGALGLALTLAGGAALAGPSGVQEFGDGEFVGEPVAHALAQTGWAAILVGGALFLGLGVGALGVAGRNITFPAWVGVAAVVVGVLQLVSVVFFPFLLIPIWVLVAAIAGLAARSPARAAAP